MSKQIKIIGPVNAVNRLCAENLTLDSIHTVCDPPKTFARNYPNTENSVWVMGEGQKIRLSNTPGKKEFCHVVE